MRQKDPVHRMRLLDGWALTRYKDSDAVLQDQARFSNAIPSAVREQTGLISMLHQDPPEHTRLRALVSQAFAPRAIEKLRFRVKRTAEQLLDAIAGQHHFDLSAAMAYPLPITIIADMMGGADQRHGPPKLYCGGFGHCAWRPSPSTGSKSPCAGSRNSGSKWKQPMGVTVVGDQAPHSRPGQGCGGLATSH